MNIIEHIIRLETLGYRVVRVLMSEEDSIEWAYYLMDNKVPEGVEIRLDPSLDRSLFVIADIPE